MSKSTDARILEEALTLFTEKGYNDTTMKGIAERVGIKAPSIYEYYSSKKELFNDVINSCFAEYFELMEAAYENVQNNPDIYEFFNTYNTMVLSISENENTYKFFFRYIIFPPEQLKLKVKNKLEEVMKVSSKVVARIYDNLSNIEIKESINKADFILWFQRMLVGDIVEIVVFGNEFDIDTITRNWSLFCTGLHNKSTKINK